jgi:DNA-binding response OmpR family regulator
VDGFMRMLIVEDDLALGTFLQRVFEREGHRVTLVGDGEQAVTVYGNEGPDLTILDLSLPKRDGESVLSGMRQIRPGLPVLILTARQDLHTRIRCLECGADDLMLKPFSFRELMARCRALLRRNLDASLQIRMGDLEIDRVARTVSRTGRRITLTNKEFTLLERLVLSRGHCLSRTELLEAVWQLEPGQTTNIVDVYVNYLRRKLGDTPRNSLIQTVRGRGYVVPLIGGAAGEMEREYSTNPGSRRLQTLDD